MRAIIKGMWCDELVVPLENYQPENPNCFGLRISLRIGSDEDEGTSDFDIYVGTPEWLEVMLRYEWGGAHWGRHMLIILEYDLDLIKERISSYIDGATGKDFLEIAQKISRVAAWEFEDYAQPKGDRVNSPADPKS